MSEHEYHLEDEVVVTDPNRRRYGDQGFVHECYGNTVRVRFEDVASVEMIPYHRSEIAPVAEIQPMFKKGDKVRVALCSLEGSPLPDGVLDVVRDQRPEDIYVRVSQWNGTFRQGYAIHALDLERFEVPADEEPDVVRLTDPRFTVGDWVRLKPTTPWGKEFWALKPAEIVEVHDESSFYYLLRFCDGGEAWHTADAFDLVEPSGDILDLVDPEPPEGLVWHTVAAQQHDRSVVQVAIVPYNYGGSVARLWVQSFDRLADGAVASEPFIRFPIELTPYDTDIIASKFISLSISGTVKLVA